MSDIEISKDIRYVGCQDYDLDLFEGQYIIPNGVSYNSYVILDEKIAIMDTVDARKSEEWLDNVQKELNGKKPDYLVIHHMEPDHSATIEKLVDLYPEVEVVSSAMAFNMMKQFFPNMVVNKKVVKENDELVLGKHTLVFVAAPSVHWPEVLFSYEKSEKILFSADGFGKFGTLDYEDLEGWACEARRYYFNIVGKFGSFVQKVLAKAAKLEINMILPLHGPILKEDLGYYIHLYDIWSSYRAEEPGIFIAYTSVYGNTKKIAEILADKLKVTGVKVAISDLARDDLAECVEDAFRYDRMICLSPTIDGGMFPMMETFLSHLKAHSYQNRTVALVENGTWAPMAAKAMKSVFDSMKDITICENIVSIKSAYNPSYEAKLDALVAELTK